MPTQSMRDGSYVALTKCFYCLKDDKIILHKRFGDVSDMHGKVIDLEPCPACAEFMKHGVILLGIVEAKCEPGWERERIPNPYRSGAFVGVKSSAMARMCNTPSLVEWALKHRWMFIEHDALIAIGAIPTDTTTPTVPAPEGATL